jgi:hypothetical protein
MIFRQVFSNGEALLRYEKKTVAIFIPFHFVAGTYPFSAAFEFRLLVRVEITRAERSTKFIYMGGKACDHGLSHALVGVATCSGLPRVLFEIGPHPLEAFFRRLIHCVELSTKVYLLGDLRGQRHSLAIDGKGRVLRTAHWGQQQRGYPISCSAARVRSKSEEQETGS